MTDKTTDPKAAAAADTATAADTAAAPAAPVPARVLLECAYGPCNSVADVPAAQLAEAKAAGLVDDDPAAVAYARTLAA